MDQPPKEERRRARRGRVIYSGTIAYNQGRSTLECVIQNVSDSGAKIVVDHPHQLPDHIDLFIHRRGEARRAKIVWREEFEAGLAFVTPTANGATISIDWARRLRECEAERDALKARVAELMARQ